MFSHIPHLAPLSPGKVRNVFGGFMMLVETLSALGVALASNVHGSAQGLGKILSLVALAMQLVTIAVFMAMASVFHRRCVRARMRAKAISTLMPVLYASMMLILIRCIYRLIEHTGNSVVQIDNLQALQTLTPILRYEAFFYVFEATIMLLNSILWNLWSPGRLLPRNHRTQLGQDGETELQRESQPENSRLLLVETAKSALAVLTFGASEFVFRRKESQTSEEVSLHNL